MFSKEDIIKLKENSEIKFIYEIPNSLYENGYEYVIVGDLETKTEENLRQFNFEDWFLRMQAGSLLPYVCSIAIRKHKIKEFLNIYDRPDLLKFRKFVLTVKLPDNEVIQECLWACQIISEFRVNRPDVFTKEISKEDALSQFLTLVDPIFKYNIKDE